MWHVLRTAPGLVHVYPLDDVVAHELADGCACGPTPELVPNPDGPDGWMWTHHSLDGREATERARDAG